MDLILFSLIVLAALTILLAIGVPVAFALFSASALGLILYHHGNPSSLYTIVLIPWRSSTEFIFLCIPLFVFMGQIMSDGKIGFFLFDIASKWLSWLPGGLLISTIGACALFAALCGTSIGTAAAIGVVAYPELLRRGYPKQIIAGVISAGGGLGMLIPPSVPMLIYCALTDVSVGQMFIAGIIPGFLLAFLYCLRVFYYVFQGAVRIVEPKASWSERLISIRTGLWGIGLIPVVLGGFYFGLFTPTEAGAIGAVGAAFITIALYRTINLNQLRLSLESSLKTSLMIYAIFFGALLFGHVLTLLQMPAILTKLILGLEIPVWALLIVVNIFYLILGCFLDTGSLTMITIPLIFPVLMKLGINPIWLGVMLMVNFNMAVETPPIGLNLYVIQSVLPGLTLEEVVKGVIPFYICELTGLILVITFPVLSLWLPSIMIGQ